MGNLTLKDCLIDSEREIDIEKYKGFESTIPIQEILNISDEVLDKYYEAARSLLEEKRYEEASAAFTFLCFITPLYSSFWLGLGIAEQSQGFYDAACVAYFKAIETDPSDPTSYANLVQCLLALDEKKAAEFIIEKMQEMCQENPSFTLLKESVHILRESEL